MAVNPNDTVFVEGELIFKTAKAIKVLIKTEEVWMPISKVRYDDNAEIGQQIEVEIPIWLARDKGLFE